ncbi:MAG: type II secretion system protein [Sedimentisphaerales bacterium]|jgi:type II secretory pathway pseudopilin PulG
MTIVRKSKKGTTLIEVMAAVLILTLVITGGSFLFVTGKNQIDIREQYRVASRLAGQKLEDIKAGNYDDIEKSATSESLSLKDTSYSRSTVTKDLGLYKQVDVTIQWGQAGRERNVSLVTFIAPK